MPSYYPDRQLLDPNGYLYVKAFKINFGSGVQTITPDWDVDSTWDYDDVYGRFTFDKHGPVAMYQESNVSNNPASGTSVYASITELTIARKSKPAVEKVYDLSADPMEMVLEASAPGADIVVPSLVSVSPGGTNVSPATKVTLVWDEQIVAGAGKTISLVNNTTSATIETFDLDTAPTSGAGSVEILGVQVIITPTNVFSDGVVVTPSIPAGAFEDLAGNACLAVSAGTHTFTIAAVAPPPPPPVTGGILVGDLTGAGVKVHPATSYSGSSHFQLVNGFIETTAAGASANFNGSPYSVTIDGSSATITTVTNGLSVDDITSAHAARDTAQASPSTDWTIILCSGVDFANLSTWNASTAAMNGTFSHPDFNFSTFRTTKDGDTYTNDAETTVSGGSITYRPSGYESGYIQSYVNLNSNGRTIFDGRWNFCMQSHVRQWGVIEGGPSYNGFPTASSPYRTIYQFSLGNGNGTPSGCIVFKNGVSWGIEKLGLEPGFATSIMLTNNIAFLSIEKGCKADGFIIFGNFNACRCYNIEDMEWQRGAEDAMRCFGTKGLGGSLLDRRIVKSTVRRVYGYDGTVESDYGVTWLSFHADWMQDRISNDVVGIGGFVADCIVEQTADCVNLGARLDAYFDGTNGKPDFRGIWDPNNPTAANTWKVIKARGTQGRIINDTQTPPLCTTQFRRILFIGNTANSWFCGAGDNVNASDIMSVFDMHASSASSFNCNASGVPWGSHTGYGPKWGGGTWARICGFSPTGNSTAVAMTVQLANNATASNSPKNLFNGTDGNGGGFSAVSFTGRFGNTYSGCGVIGLDHSSHAAFRADCNARFTPRAGGALAGFQPPAV